MAVTTADLLALPYTPGLTTAGVAYACRSLAFTYDRMGGSPTRRMRRIAAGKAVELAFRRALADRGVPFDLHGATPFSDPDRYDLAIAGRRCDLKSFVLDRKSAIRPVHEDPGRLLAAAALVPADQLAAAHRPDDLYVFAFLTALTAERPEDWRRALQAGQPAALVHPLPARWANPDPWQPLGRLALKCEVAPSSHAPLELEIGGQTGEHRFQTQDLRLPPGRRVEIRREFYSLAYLRLSTPPPGRLGVSSPALDEVYLAGPEGWGNVWVYGLRIFIAGWMAHGEFRDRARRLPAGSRVLQYDRTRTDNWALPVAELHPLEEFYAAAGSG